MMRIQILATLAAISACLLVTELAVSNQGDWKPLFDGKTLNGWRQRNGTATYRVENGSIIGRTEEGSPNSFLCTEKHYGDFELEFDVKCDRRLNSGVQIRSKAKDNAQRRVYGPQVEIESTAAGGLAGYVYGEATGRGWLSPEKTRKRHQMFIDGGWNHYRVVAKGPRIQTWINGQKIEDLTDQQAYETHPRGFVGLQVHGVGRESGPFEVAWRKLRIRPL